MTQDFCLLDEPWLPVRMADGKVIEVGIVEAFQRSGEIVALAETAPPSLVAEYRILLAITHRALVTAFGTWSERDRVRWYREGLPVKEIVAYLEQWRGRFSLFDSQHPFMQVPQLRVADETKDKHKPWTAIDLPSSSGNTPVVFDHSTDVAPAPIAPKRAIAALLGFLQFTPGGLVKALRGSDKAGALGNTAASIPVGINFAKTLCLALHAAPREGSPPDLPSWERNPPTIVDLLGDPTLASGPNDRYTRLSRAVLLGRESDGAVRWIHFAAGVALGEDPNAPDPMASFRTGSHGLVRITFSEGRALWRDLPALLPNTGFDSQAAAVVQGAVALHRALEPFETVYQPLLVGGLASDKAKLLRWRLEQVVLPSALLREPDKAIELREKVAIAEELYVDVRKLANRMVTESLPDKGSKDTRSRAAAIVESGPLSAAFFSAAERSLPCLLRLIGEGSADDADALWRATLRSAAEAAWSRVVEGIGGSARALRAEATCWPRFRGLLNRHIPLQETNFHDEEAIS